MKDRKSCSFLLHKYFVPSLHCIWDKMFRKAPCFRTVTPRRTYIYLYIYIFKKKKKNNLSDVITGHMFMVQQSIVLTGSQLIMLHASLKTQLQRAESVCF